MPNTNDFLPFCATDTGTNLIEQAAYVASSARPVGNQPGIASSAFNNKALRQGTYVVSQLAQYISNYANVGVLDNAVPAQLLSQMMAAFQPLAPVLTQMLTGSGTWNATYNFFIAAGNATTGATYTNNSITYTVTGTITAGLILKATGSGDPTANGGTLTKASGTGDSTITFYAFRKALHLEVLVVGGGGGGQGGGSGPTPNAGAGSNSTFGTSFLTGAGGSAGVTGQGGAGGLATISGAVGISITGSEGAPPSEYGSGIVGGNGGVTALGGAGVSNANVADASPGVANSGSGGGGGGGNVSFTGGGGGGAGGYIKALVFSPNSSYGWVIGAGGSAGGNGSSGWSGGIGGSGYIQVLEVFQ